MFTVFIALIQPLFLVVLAVLAILCLSWVLAWLGRALEGIEYHGIETRRIPTDAPRQWYRRGWARLTRCTRQGHDEVYTFRLARPAYACRRCGRWRPREVVTTFGRERWS